MEIRKATIQDYEQMDEVYLEEDFYHHLKDPKTNKKPTKYSRTKELIEGFINSEDSDIFVAEENKKIVGLVHVFKREGKENNIVSRPDHAYIGDLGVLEKYRGRGIAKSLMAEAEKWAKEKNLSKMVLRADAFNDPAISLYNKIGYKTFSVEMEKYV